MSQIQKAPLLVVPNKYEQIVTQICRLVRLHNSTSMIGFTAEDVRSMANDVQADYDLKTVELARDEIVGCYANSALTIGKFLEICEKMKKADRSINSTQSFLSPIKQRRKDLGRTVFAEAKEGLNRVAHKLPYHKTESV